MINHSLLVAKDQTRVTHCLPSLLSSSPNKLGTTDVYLLPPASISNVSGIVERIREGDGYIREVVLKARRNRKYLLIIRHNEKKRYKNINMEDVHMSAPTVRRLLIEALNLLEQLHEAGIKLNFPLQQLLQPESYMNQESLSFINVRNETNQKQKKKIFEKNKTTKGGFLDER